MAAAEQTHRGSLPWDDFMQIAQMGSAELNNPALEENYLKIVLAHIKGSAQTAMKNQTV